MNRERATRLLSLHEGRRNTIYKDSLGYWTVGVGHLIDPSKGGTLPEAIIDALLRYDMTEKYEELVKTLPWVRDLDEVRQYVLLDMAFNLGVNGLLGFKNTLKMVQGRDYAGAAKNMLLSRWATQVGTRAKRLSVMMESGSWPA